MKALGCQLLAFGQKPAAGILGLPTAHSRQLIAYRRPSLNLPHQLAITLSRSPKPDICYLTSDI